MQRTLKGKLYMTLSILLILIVGMSFAIFALGDKEVSEGAVISNADVISQDLLMSDKTTRGSSVGSPVFNENALNLLYAKLGGANSTFSTIETAARVPKSNYSDSSVKAIHSGMDSADIRSANGGNNVVVKLDGKEWIVTALTTKDNSATSDVILTLMLKDTAYDSKWGAWAPSNVKDFSATYPATMYSTSYIRAGLLNDSSIQYTTNGTAKVSFSDTGIYGAGGYPFAIYTDSTETGNITNFLVKPNEVLYQQHENLFDISQGKQSGVWYNAPNDSSKYAIPDNKWYSKVADTSYGTHQIQDKTGYYDWGNDLIWLPSLSETGQNSRTGVNADGGLWKLDSSQRGVSAGKVSWLCSGFSGNSTYAYYL
ncbi:MAG: hypothetical protein K2I23_03420, partial [Clostridia bacterium]|nr:hypothetical protein [Clostridia bacterium]